MKKKILILLLFIAVIVACLIPFSKPVAVKINASYFNCYQQLFTLQNWKNWQPGISSSFKKDSSLYQVNDVSQGFKLVTPGEYFLVKKFGTDNLLVKRVWENNDFNYALTIIPNTLGLTTTIIVTIKTNALGYLIPALENRELNKTSIFDFKHYMEDVKRYYGFNLKTGFATEKKFMVKSKIIATGQMYTEAAESQKQLNNYILLKHLKQVAPMITQYIPKSGDSLQMLVGIPVNQPIPAGNGFLYMYMPPTRVLIADFKGKYRDRKKVYTAMAKYVQDKFITTKNAPFEVFTNKLPATADDVVEFRLTYPIL